MKSIYVLVEHREGKIRDITWELLAHAAQLAQVQEAEITALLIGAQVEEFIASLQPHAHQLLVIDDPKLRDVNAAVYQAVLEPLIKERQPYLVLMAHSYFGMDLAPSLAASLQLPLVTDAVALELSDQGPVATRMIYSGKVGARVALAPAATYLITMRAGTSPTPSGGLNATVTKLPCPFSEPISQKRFLEYIAAQVGDVDITQADIVVGVGRGIKEEENLPLVQELAEALGGVLAASRPVTDAGWLPKDRQVGSSGKTLKAKMYVAVGISGSFQHVVGIKGCETIVAINKDPNAPIFTQADYGIVGDLFKVLPPLTEKIKALKASS